MATVPFESSLDPILPLPADTGIVRDGRPGWGKEILENDNVMTGTDGMTSRAFWHVWEHAEITAAKSYPRYVGGPMDHVAQTWLEAVVWCRNIAYKAGNFGEGEVVAISEKKAKKIRAKELEEATKTAAAKKAAKSTPVEKAEVRAATGKMTAAQKKCEHAEKEKIKRNDVPMWKCSDCHYRWPRDVAGSTVPEPVTVPKKAKRTKPPEEPVKSKKKDKKAKKKSKK